MPTEPKSASLRCSKCRLLSQWSMYLITSWDPLGLYDYYNYYLPRKLLGREERRNQTIYAYLLTKRFHNRMNFEEPRPRVNASMLPSFQGKGVTLLGTAHDPSDDGMSFQVTASDGQDVHIALQSPLQEYVQGTVEVHGIVGQNNTVECSNYIQFPTSDNIQQFDLESYNRAVLLANQLPDHYIQRAAVSQ